MHVDAMKSLLPDRSQSILACLGDESRFRVVSELVRGERCVTDLAGLVGLSQSCTTRHLQALERVGIVTSMRAGKRVLFRVSEEPRVVALIAWALPRDSSLPVMRDREPVPMTEPARASVSTRPASPIRELEDFLL